MQKLTIDYSSFTAPPGIPSPGAPTGVILDASGASGNVFKNLVFQNYEVVDFANQTEVPLKDLQTGAMSTTVGVHGGFGATYPTSFDKNSIYAQAFFDPTLFLRFPLAPLAQPQPTAFNPASFGLADPAPDPISQADYLNGVSGGGVRYYAVDPNDDGQPPYEYYRDFLPYIIDYGSQALYDKAYAKQVTDTLAQTVTSFDLVRTTGSGASMTNQVIGRATFAEPIAVGQIVGGALDAPAFPVEFIGSSLADRFVGTSFGDTFYGTPGDDILSGGPGNDTFDYATKGLAGFAPGALQSINGGAENPADLLNKGKDLLKLPGSADGYQVTVSFFGPPIGPSLPISWENTSTYFAQGPLIGPPSKFFDTRTVEKVTFANPVASVVTPTGGHIATEALQLAAEAYGPRPTLGHLAEDIAYEKTHAADTNRAYVPTVGLFAAFRGWHRVEAMELGIKPADFDDPAVGSLSYSLVNGFYAGYDPSALSLVPITSDTPEANALVLTGVLQGKRTLAIAFRGTDQIADFKDYLNFNNYYKLYKPLTDALTSYINDPANGIQQVLVSGHSLGAGAVQYFMHDHLGDARFRAYTDGSPGSDHEDADEPDGRITNIMRTDDAVTFVPTITGFTSSVIGKAALVGLTTSAAALTGGGLPQVLVADYINSVIITAQRKFRQGGEVSLNSPISGDFTDLKEHDKSSYVTDTAMLHLFAEDTESPFYTHQLAQDLRAERNYNGAPVQLAIGRTGMSGHGHGASDYDWDIIPDDDDDFVLGGTGRDVFLLKYNVVANADGGRIVDGGTDYDEFVLFDKRSDFVITTVGAKTVIELKGDTYAVTGWTYPVATLYRVEKISFLTDEPILLAAPDTQTAPPGATSITVDPTREQTEAGAGVIMVTGTTGNDRILLGPTTHEVFAGEGDDTVTVKPPAGPAPGPVAPAAPEDNVTLHGEAGNDFLAGGTGDDLLLGDDGNDTLIGGAGINILRGGAGNDTYVIMSLTDTADEGSGSGVDVVLTELATFALTNPKILGVFENLTGSGVAGQSLTGNALVNKITGALGDDTLAGAGEADLLDGGDGIDVASAAGSTGVAYLDLLSAPGIFFDGTGAVDLILNIEGAVGGSGGDFLNGDHGANILRGGGATDAILGRGGNDAIDGGDGDDYLMGGDAYDPAQFGSGDDTIDGGAGSDIIFGMGGNDTINGGDGADFILAGTGDDIVEGGAGNDFLFGGTNYVFDQVGAGNDAMKGGDGVDFIVGGQGADTLDGEGADDILYGGSGVDQVRGGAGSDSLFGDAGNDVMLGGAGFDYIYGGAGADVFSFRKDDSYDSVFDFVAAQGDKLRLDPALGVGTFAAFQMQLSGFTFEGFAYSVLNFASLGFNDQITIKGVSHTAWTSGMVEFA